MKSLKTGSRKLQLQKKTVYNFHLAKEQMKQIAGGLEPDVPTARTSMHADIVIVDGNVEDAGCTGGHRP